MDTYPGQMGGMKPYCRRTIRICKSAEKHSFHSIFSEYPGWVNGFSVKALAEWAKGHIIIIFCINKNFILGLLTPGAVFHINPRVEPPKLHRPDDFLAFWLSEICLRGEHACQAFLCYDSISYRFKLLPRLLTCNVHRLWVPARTLILPINLKATSNEIEQRHLSSASAWNWIIRKKGEETDCSSTTCYISYMP